MAWVKIKHPDTGGEATVLDSSLKLWVKQGWMREVEAVAEPEPADSWETDDSEYDPADEYDFGLDANFPSAY
jgi:hypothetical protein